MLYVPDLTNPRTIQRDENKGPCFTDEEMEPQRGKMTCPRSQANSGVRTPIQS